MSDTRVYREHHYEDTDPKRSGVFGLNAPQLGSFLNLAEPRRVSKSLKEEPKYSINVEIPDDHPVLAAARGKISAVARAKWPGKDIGAAIKDGSLQVPLSNGNALAEKAIAKGKSREWSRGKQVLVARSQFQPEISIVSGGKAVVLNEDPLLATKCKEFFYTGALILVELNFAAYDAVGTDGKPGVNAYVNIVCSTCKGEKLIKGGDRSAEAFKGYIGLEVSDSAADPVSASEW